MNLQLAPPCVGTKMEMEIEGSGTDVGVIEIGSLNALRTSLEMMTTNLYKSVPEKKEPGSTSDDEELGALIPFVVQEVPACSRTHIHENQSAPGVESGS